MATVTKPIALDETFNTTEVTPRNTADVLAQELSAIATAIGNQQSAGHTIENPAGGLMPQRDGLQFVDSHLNDDSANNRTQVEALKPVTSATFETETADGFYFITDEDEQPLTADDIPYDSTHSVGDMIDALGTVSLTDTESVPHGSGKKTMLFNVDGNSLHAPSITFGTLMWHNHNSAFGVAHIFSNTGIYRRIYASNAWEASWTKLV